MVYVDGWSISKDTRDRMAKSGSALPDGSMPISKCSGGEGSVESAVRVAGNHDEPAKARRHTIKRAKALGCPDKIPDTWKADGTLTASALVTRGTRAEIISSFLTAAADEPTAEPAVDDDDYEPQPYHVDPDETIVCPNCQKLNDTDASFCDQCGFKLAGAAGVTTADTQPATPAPAATPSAAASSDAQSFADVPNDTVCATCTHLASAHGDTSFGANTGACTMANCDCSAMKVPGETSISGNGTSDQSQTALADAPAAPPAVETAQSTVIEGEPFTIPVLIVEGKMTSDGRMIEPNALDWRTPPLPLMFSATTAHGYGEPDAAVLVGKIETLAREGQNIVGTGHFLTTEEALDCIDKLQQMGRLGISADVSDVQEEIAGMPPLVGPSDGEFQPDDTTPGETPDVAELYSTLLKGTLMGATICMFPAFPDAYIVLGEGTAENAAIPMQAPTAEQSAMGIHIIDVHECEPCKGEPLTLVAAAAPSAPPRKWFEVAEPDLVMPMTVTDDGQVFGHLAAWGVCHIGIQGKCVTAPRSASGYAYYHLGAVQCDDGTLISTGPLTVDTTHASQAIGTGWADTQAHYEHTGNAVADVKARDGKHGIWVCGALRPWATSEQIRALRAAPPSGDWRKIAGSLELVAALGVNTPGFMSPRAVLASGEIQSLVAAGRAPIVSLATSSDELTIEQRLVRVEQIALTVAPLAVEGLRARWEAVA